MSGQKPATPLCPLCSQLPYAVLGGGTQAFCATDDCKVITWDPTKPVDELLTDIAFIDLKGFTG